MTTSSREDIDVLLRRAGLTLSPAEVDQIHDGWARVEPMLGRIRGEHRDHAAAPAHIFRADACERQADETETP